MSPKKGARLEVRSSSFGHPKCSLRAFIFGHPLNNALQIVVPEDVSPSGPYKAAHGPEKSLKVGGEGSICKTEPSCTGNSAAGTHSEVLADGPTKAVVQRIGSRKYTLVRCNTACLMEHDFVERHIRALVASFCAISVNATNVEGDSAAILPDGKLHMAVSEGTYRRLGLQGAHMPHDKGRYHIEVDLFGRSYQPAAPFYAKVMACLKKHTGLVDFICSKTIDGAPAEIPFPPGSGVTFTCQQAPQFSKAFHSGISAPPLSPLLRCKDALSELQLQGCMKSLVLYPGQKAAAPEATPDDLHAMYEWLGGLACSIPGGGSWCPERETRDLSGAQDVTTLAFTGLLPSCSVWDAIQAARQHLREAGGAWAAVHVWGFQHAPVSWHAALHGHGPMLGGENDSTVLLLPEDQYVLYVAAGEGDHFRSVGGHEDA